MIFQDKKSCTKITENLLEFSEQLPIINWTDVSNVRVVECRQETVSDLVSIIYHNLLIFLFQLSLQTHFISIQ